jgi:hypothetical protein
MSVTSSPDIEIFDPPMCCSNGLCGPVVDPALLDVHETILRLKTEGTADVKRYLLQQQSDEFVKNPQVMKMLKDSGTEVLPITVVNGAVVKSGSYPAYEELISYIETAAGNRTG